MPRIHPVSIAAAAWWSLVLALALLARDLSAAAGRLPESWTGPGMLVGFLHLGVVIAGFWFLPERLPRLLVRLAQIAAMACGLWSAGTLTRALYALLD